MQIGWLQQMTEPIIAFICTYRLLLINFKLGQIKCMYVAVSHVVDYQENWTVGLHTKVGGVVECVHVCWQSSSAMMSWFSCCIRKKRYDLQMECYPNLAQIGPLTSIWSFLLSASPLVGNTPTLIYICNNHLYKLFSILFTFLCQFRSFSRCF